MYRQQNNRYLTNNTECIDTQFSFSNEVYPSKDNITKTKNMICDGNIMLEPRLQEYIKKKKFYKQNGIYTDVSIEKEFNITNKDKKILKDFLNGKKNMYLKGNKYVEPSSNKSEKKIFPSKFYRDDSRVLKVDNINRNNNLPNRGMFYSDTLDEYYEKDMTPLDVNMDMRDFAINNRPENYQEKYNNEEDINGLFTTDDSDKVYGWSLNETKFNPRIDPKIDPGVEDKNNYNSQYRINSNMPTFKDHMYTNKESVALTTKGSVALTKGSVALTELENSLVRGMPSNNKSKSYGYRNVDEHYYDYIDDDFQHPDNVVLPFPRGGEGTRQFDKGLARNNNLYNNNRNNC